MSLQIGGGRESTINPTLESIFGQDWVPLQDGQYEVEWLGRFRRRQDNWIEHETEGLIAAISYQKGFYWFQRADGPRFLTGPAIYPRTFEYPLTSDM
jgi:hypothetical protein